MINSVAAKIRIKALLVRFENETESILENVIRSSEYHKTGSKELCDFADEIDEAVRLYTIKMMGLE